MRRIATWIIVVFFAGCLSGQQSKPVTVMRLYSSADGPALADTSELKLTPSATYAFAEQSETFKASGIQFLRLPRGKVQDWHNPAHRQYILVLKGKCEVEIEGGKKLLMTPGQIVLLEDVTGKGAHHAFDRIGRSADGGGSIDIASTGLQPGNIHTPRGLEHSPC